MHQILVVHLGRGRFGALVDHLEAHCVYDHVVADLVAPVRQRDLGLGELRVEFIHVAVEVVLDDLADAVVDQPLLHLELLLECRVENEAAVDGLFDGIAVGFAETELLIRVHTPHLGHHITDRDDRIVHLCRETVEGRGLGECRKGKRHCKCSFLHGG